jgi:flagellar motor switch protein FliM
VEWAVWQRRKLGVNRPGAGMEDMDKTLSKDEMNALLGASGESQGTHGNKEEAEHGGTPGAGRGFMIYDFRRPDRVPKATLQSFHLLHDRFCTNAAAALSAYLRTITEFSLSSVDQTNFGEFMMSLPDPTYLSALSMRPLMGMAALELSLDLVFPLIDRLLGGTAQPPNAGRKITEIEKTVNQGVITVITTNLADAWRPTAEVNFSFYASETRPQLLQVAAPREAALAFVFDVKIGDTRGPMHLCIPYSTLEPVRRKLEQEAIPPRKIASSADSGKVLRCLRRAPFEITSELPPTIVSVRDLLSLGKGDVIRLDIRVADPVHLHVGGKPVFVGEPLEVNGHNAAGVIRRIDG